MADLWICKTCLCLGPPSWYGTTRRRLSAPACSSCGHRTIVPADSPKGADLLTKAGITAADLERAVYASYRGWMRVVGIIIGTMLIAGNVAQVTEDASKFSPVMVFVSLVLIVACVVSLRIHKRDRPTGSSPPAP